MNSSIFLYAQTPLSAADHVANWMTNDNDSHYKEIDPLDFSQELLDPVYSLYRDSYAQYAKSGGNTLISSAFGLLKYNRWIILYDDNDPSREAIGFSIFKTSDYGIKAGLTGSNGGKPAKRKLISFKISSLNQVRIYGEISGRLEEIIIDHVPTVPFSEAEKILNRLGKSDVKKDDGDHYLRRIGSLGIVKKIMVGLPKKK